MLPPVIIRKWEAEIAGLRAEIDGLKYEVSELKLRIEKLTHERDVARAALERKT